MSDLQEVRENFKRTQESFSKVFPKVNPQLLINLLLNEQQDPNNAPIYTLEVFMKKGTDLEKVRDTICHTPEQYLAFMMEEPTS